MGALIALCVVLIGLLWVATALRRRSIRTYLLAMGERVPGTARMVSPRRGRYPSLQVQYVDGAGVQHTGLKVPIGAGDAELAQKKVVVLYSPTRPTREDYVLVGFGVLPGKWFRIRMTRSGKSVQ